MSFFQRRKEFPIPAALVDGRMKRQRNPLPLPIHVPSFPSQFDHPVPLRSRAIEVFLQCLLKDVLIRPPLGRPQRAQAEVQPAVNLERECHWLLW